MLLSAYLLKRSCLPLSCSCLLPVSLFEKMKNCFEIYCNILENFCNFVTPEKFRIMFGEKKDEPTLTCIQFNYICTGKEITEMNQLFSHPSLHKNLNEGTLSLYYVFDFLLVMRCVKDNLNVMIAPKKKKRKHLKFTLIHDARRGSRICIIILGNGSIFLLVSFSFFFEKVRLKLIRLCVTSATTSVRKSFQQTRHGLPRLVTKNYLMLFLSGAKQICQI